MPDQVWRVVAHYGDTVEPPLVHGQVASAAKHDSDDSMRAAVAQMLDDQDISRVVVTRLEKESA